MNIYENIASHYSITYPCFKTYMIKNKVQRTDHKHNILDIPVLLMIGSIAVLSVVYGGYHLL